MATTCKLIAKNVLGSASATITFSSIPQTGYTDLLLVCSTRTTRSSAADYVSVRPNGATTNLSIRTLQGQGSGGSSGTDTGWWSINNGATSTSNCFSSHEFYIPNYAGSTNKSVSITGVMEQNDATAYIQAIAGLWSSTSAITSLDVVGYYNSFVSGSSFFLYGISKA
jgi:hypothetical protein